MPQTELQWQTLVAWVLVHKLGFTLFGGFLRDRLHSPDTAAKDIDAAVNTANDKCLEERVDKIMNNLNMGVEQGLNHSAPPSRAHYRRQQNSAVNNLYYQVPLPGHGAYATVHVQLVDKSSKYLNWNPDLTINGLGLSHQKGLHAIDDSVPLEKVLDHISQSVMEWNDTPSTKRFQRAETRLSKFQERGFRLQGQTLIQRCLLDKLMHSQVVGIVKGTLGQALPRPRIGQHKVVAKFFSEGGNSLFDALVKAHRDSTLTSENLRDQVANIIPSIWKFPAARQLGRFVFQHSLEDLDLYCRMIKKNGVAV